MGAFEIFVIVLAIVLAILVIASAIIVPQGYNYTVERLGRFVRTLKPGLRIVAPFLEQVGRRMNMMEQVLDVPTQDVITRDNVVVRVDAVAFIKVLDAPRAAYQVANLEQAMLNLILTNIRTVMGSMDLDELLSNRDNINSRLLKIVDQATDPWGVKVTRIEIKDIEPPSDIVEAMGRQMKAERDKRATVLDAEAEKSEQILRAEGLKQSLILQAEGRKQAAILDAEARERTAQADATATEMVSTAIAGGSIQAINYFVATSYVDALKSLASAPNQKVLMMPVDAASVIGAVSGIAELTREAFGNGTAMPPQTNGPQAPGRMDAGSRSTSRSARPGNGDGSKDVPDRGDGEAG